MDFKQNVYLIFLPLLQFFPMQIKLCPVLLITLGQILLIGLLVA